MGRKPKEKLERLCKIIELLGEGVVVVLLLLCLFCCFFIVFLGGGIQIYSQQ